MVENSDGLVHINDASKSARFIELELVNQCIRNKLREGDTELIKSGRQPKKGKDMAMYVFHYRLDGRVRRRSDE